MDPISLESGIVLRERKEEDFENYLSLLKANMSEYLDKFMTGFSREKAAERYDVGNFYVVEREGEFVGFLQVGFYEDFTYLHEIHLLSKVHGQGIGGILLNWLEQEAKQRGYNSLRLSVFEGNPVFSLYKRRGFVTLEKLEHREVLEKKL